ncbi:MAG TPA: tRNA pseudouridine(38-40) synthase TruA [Gaiellaceae bacterium]|nr:tRNA pseudouridine(38-40) synthase TruA [Gaiellaceae bacterium]
MPDKSGEGALTSLLRLEVAYDGTGFRGFARQPGARTVEGVLRDALERAYGAVRALAVAGRTDTGVHALANVVSVEVEGGPPPARAPEALNALLPPDVAVVAAEEAPAGFHARFSARSRTYRYRVWRRRERSPFEVNRAHWHPRPLELQKLNASAAMVMGEHDFRAFTPTDTQHEVFVRVVEDARWHDRGDAVELEITADSFLRHMVRTLVGTMLERDPDDLVELLQGAPRTRAGSTAPACGLYLVGVGYD